MYEEQTSGMVFILVEGGRFQMGDNFGDGFPDERPVRDVSLDDYFLGQYPVTQGEWRIIMDNNPSMFKKGDRYPVEMISWDHAQAFISRVNEKTDGLFRLPTEAEWEFAARGGGRQEKWAGTNDADKAGDYMWFDGNSAGKTHPVGLKKPNHLNFYDMSGLTHEWVCDTYHVEAYQENIAHNPICQRPGRYRAFRGGSWKRHLEGLRCTRRMGGLPHLGFGTFGFRLAREVP